MLMQKVENWLVDNCVSLVRTATERGKFCIHVSPQSNQKHQEERLQPKRQHQDERVMGHCINPQPLQGDKELNLAMWTFQFHSTERKRITETCLQKINFTCPTERKERIQQAQVTVKEANSRTIAYPTNVLNSRFMSCPYSNYLASANFSLYNFNSSGASSLVHFRTFFMKHVSGDSNIILQLILLSLIRPFSCSA